MIRSIAQEPPLVNIPEKKIGSTHLGLTVRINELFMKTTFSLLNKRILSSSFFYRSAQIILLSAASVGTIAATIEIISGSTNRAYLLSFISGSAGVGAYFAYKASIQANLEQHSQDLLDQVGNLKKINENLISRIQELDKKNLLLEVQTENFKQLSAKFEGHLNSFKRQEVDSCFLLDRLAEEFKENITACQTLWQNIAKENNTKAGDLTCEIENLKKSIAGITDLKAAIHKLEELSLINYQIQEKLTHLGQLEDSLKYINEQILKGTMKLEQYEQLIEMIKSSADEAIGSFSEQNAAFKKNNKELSELIKKIKDA